MQHDTFQSYDDVLKPGLNGQMGQLDTCVQCDRRSVGRKGVGTSFPALRARVNEAKDPPEIVRQEQRK